MSFKKGYIPWNKGLTKETDERVAKSSKKILLNSNKGKKITFRNPEKRKRLLSKAKKGKSLNEMGHLSDCVCSFCKAKRGEYSGKNHPNYGKPRAKHKKDCPCSFCKAQRGEYVREKNPFYNKKQSISARKATSIGLKKYFETHDAPFKNHKHKPEVIEKIKENRMKQKNIYRNTTIEIKIQNELKKENIKFETNKSIFGQPDIFIKPNICIFCDGCYWHSCKIHFPNSKYSFRIEKDKDVNKKLKIEGYAVLRFWEHEINTNLKKCVDKIIKKYVWHNNLR